MATCPACGVSSRSDPDAMSVRRVLVAHPLGTFGLAGSQVKTTAHEELRLCCRCGWSIAGTIQGDEFVGLAETQAWPPATGGQEEQE